MATKEAELMKADIARLDLSYEELHDRVVDLDRKYQVAKPVLHKAANQNITVGIAVAITILNLLLLLLR